MFIHSTRHYYLGLGIELADLKSFNTIKLKGCYRNYPFRSSIVNRVSFDVYTR